MSNVNIADKNTGDQHTADEFNLIKNFINSPDDLLGDLTPNLLVYTDQGYYNDYTQSGDVNFTVSGILVDGICQIFKFISDGTHTVNFGIKFETSAIYGVTPGEALPAGAYWFYMLSINDKIHVNVRQVAGS